MDVLRPEIVRIGPRRYRKFPLQSKHSPENDEEYEYNAGSYVEEDLYYYDEPESCAIECSTITKTSDGQFCDRLTDVPSFYFKFIIGRGGEKKHRLEKQTNTSITIPKIGCEGDIVITGKSRSGVITAGTKIKTIIDLNRREQPADHFLAMTLSSGTLSEKFNEFKREVLKSKARGLDESIFQLPERIHVTLCLLTFLNQQEITDKLQQTVDSINQLKNKYLNSGEIKIRVKGIEYMNDDPGEVDVLYGKVVLADFKPDRLQQFVDEIVQDLALTGVAKKQYDHVKLHVTLMNTLFRSGNQKDNSRRTGKKERTTFDAKKILQDFKDFDFGELSILSLDILMRGKFTADGHYQKAAEIPLS